MENIAVVVMKQLKNFTGSCVKMLNLSKTFDIPQGRRSTTSLMHPILLEVFKIIFL